MATLIAVLLVGGVALYAWLGWVPVAILAVLVVLGVIGHYRERNSRSGGGPTAGA